MDSTNLSVMTVVLPQSGHRQVSRLSPTGCSTEACHCKCRCEGCMTKKNFHLPHKAAHFKGHFMEECRPIMDPSVMKLTTREWKAMREAVCFWQEKYDRLYESHKKLQKVNQGLEEKLLQVVDKLEGEKADLTRDLSDLTSRLVEARLTISELEDENEQYRNDCNIAVRLLQCKPSNFIAHKINSLPSDIQEQVKDHLNTNTNNKRDPARSRSPEVRTIKVTVPTLPPTAMVYSVSRKSGHGSKLKVTAAKNPSDDNNNTHPDYVSAAIMAKVLEERGKERTTKKQRLCVSCHYKSHIPSRRDTSTQTWGASCNNCKPHCACSCVHHRCRTGSVSSKDQRNQNNPASSTETAI